MNQYENALIEYDSMGGGDITMWVIGIVGLMILMSAGWYFIKDNIK